MSRPTSAALRNIVKGSHNARARATLVANSNPLFPQSLTPSGTRLTILDGDVRMDSSATVRATIDCTVQARWGTIKPNGAELFVEYGVDIAGGQTEWTSLGYFRVEDVTQDEVNGPIRITGSDRMAQVADTENDHSRVAPAGTTHRDFFSSLLYGQAPATWFHLNTGVFPYGVAAGDQVILSDYDMSTATLPYQIPLEKHFNEHFNEVADLVGKRVFFDYKGRLSIVNADVDLTATPVTTINAGAGGVLRSMSRQITRDGVYTIVISSGSDPSQNDPPYDSALFDNNGFIGDLYVPAPPGLSWYGKFGRVLKRFSSPLLTTTAACNASSRTWLGKITGLPYTLSLEMVADPTLEPLDVVKVRFPGLGPSNTPPVPGMLTDPSEEIHVIDTLTFPLAGGSMQVTTRGTTVSAVESA